MLYWFKQKSSEKYEIDHNTRLGLEGRDDESVRLLNRMIERNDEGVTIEAEYHGCGRGASHGLGLSKPV